MRKVKMMRDMEFNELSEEELTQTEGGVVPPLVIAGGVVVAAGVGFGMAYVLARAFG